MDEHKPLTEDEEQAGIMAALRYLVKDPPPWAGLFLRVYMATGSMRRGLRAVGISKPEFDRVVKKVPGMAEALKDAQDALVDDLETEARARALGGSDRLLVFLLKSHRPDVYGDRLDVNQTTIATVELTDPRDSALAYLGEPGAAEASEAEAMREIESLDYDQD